MAQLVEDGVITTQVYEVVKAYPEKQDEHWKALLKIDPVLQFVFDVGTDWHIELLSR